MTMLRWHSKPLDRVPLEVELNHHRRFVPDDPTIMSRVDGNRLRGGEFTGASVGVLDMDLAAHQETDVRMLTQVPADSRLHVFRPAESGRVDYPLDAAVACSVYVDLHTANLAMLGSGNGRCQRIKCHSVVPRLKIFYSIEDSGPCT
jgi:hypothetical protein